MTFYPIYFDVPSISLGGYKTLTKTFLSRYCIEKLGADPLFLEADWGMRGLEIQIWVAKQNTSIQFYMYSAAKSRYCQSSFMKIRT